MGPEGDASGFSALAAGMLEASAGGYASAAAAALGSSSAGESAAGATFSLDQRAWFAQRILELAAAVRLQAPEVFVRRAAWLRRAMLARGQDEAELRTALTSLRDALRQELPDHLAGVVTAPVERALETMLHAPEPEASALDPSDPAGRLALLYLEGCLAAEPERAIETVLSGLGELTPEQMLTRVLAPAEHEIGRLWHGGDVSIAEERLVSETTRQLLAIIAHRCAPPRRIARTVVTASVPGNIHDLGLRIAADLFRLRGWRSIFLGPTMPADQLARAAAMFGADLVVLSVVLATQLVDAAHSVEAIRRSAAGAKVVVGGSAFDDAPDSWRQIGADGYAPTLDEVVAVGASLVGE